MKVYVEANTGKVFLSVTHRGKRFYVYSGLQTTEKFKGMVFPKSDKSGKAKTARLAKLFAQMEDYLLMHDEETVEDMKVHLKELVTGAKAVKKGTMFVDYLREYGESRSRENTRRSYARTVKCVAAYDGTATLESMDRRWVEGFIKHEADKGRKLNGIATDVTHMKAAFRKAIDDEKTTSYPFNGIRMKKEETKKRCLSLEQMRAFRDTKAIRRNGELYRDCFMLGFYLIGINISDLLTLKKEDFRNGRISYYRNKTGKLYDIKVEPEALEIMDRHKGTKGGLLLDFMERMKIGSVNSFTVNMNKSLRRIGERDDDDKRRRTGAIEPKVSTYYNRHTWATFASEIGIPMEVIGRALGHSFWDRSVTATYVKYDNRTIDDANRKVIDYLNADKRK